MLAKKDQQFAIAVEALKAVTDVNRCDPVLDANDREEIADKALQKLGEV